MGIIPEALGSKHQSVGMISYTKTYFDYFFQIGLEVDSVLMNFVLIEMATVRADYYLPKDLDLDFEHAGKGCLSGSAVATSLMPTLQPTAVSGSRHHRIVYWNLYVDK